MSRPGSRRAALARRLTAGACVTAALALPSGARAASTPAPDWPLFRGDPQLTGVAASALPADLKPLWTHRAAAGIESSAVVAGSLVYVAALDGKLQALALDSGAVKWTYDAGAPIKSSPSVFAGIVYVGDESGILHAVDAGSGARRWTFATEAAVASSANLAGDLIVFGSEDNNLYALTAKDGKQVWKVTTGGYVYGTPAVFDSGGVMMIASAGCDGFLRLVRARDGQVLSKLELGGYVGASPAVLKDRAWVGTFENAVLGIDLKGPRLLWSYTNPDRQFPYFASAAVSDQLVVVGGRDKTVSALEPASGRRVWAYVSRAKVDSSPVIVGDRVYAANAAGDLFALGLKSGEKLWQYETGAAILGTPAIAQGRLFIGNADGLFHAFGGK